jgi:hypothetical protein
MLRDGNITNLPNLTSEDVRRANELFGNTPEFVRGRMTRKKVSRAVVDDGLVLEEKKLTLYTDVMHIDGQRFLVTVCDPLQLTLQVNVERELQNVLGPALQGQIDLLHSKGFSPRRVYVDPQSALKTLATKFENVSVDVGGASDFVPKVDAKIRRIKERYRSIKAGLKWNLPKMMVKDLIAYVVSRINSERSAAINQNVAPKVMFTGLRMDYKKEFSLAFGDYCEVYHGTDNTLRARSIPCIALYPCNNVAGSWAFLSLMSKQRIRRSQWTKMVTTEEMVNRMNAMDGMDETPTKDDENVTTEREELPPSQQEAGILEGVDEGATDDMQPSPAEVHDDPGCPDLVDQSDGESDDEGDEEEEEAEEVQRTVRRSERIREGVAKPERYAAVTRKVRQAAKDDEQKAEEVKKAKITEIKQVFEELQALQPVEKAKIPANVKPLGSHLFTVEKFTATGQHDKYKSRLVSHGNEQDTLLYPDRSSPTAAVHTILTALTVAACNREYELGKIDVKGAFIQTEMSGMPVYIKCRGQLKELIVSEYPEYAKFVGTDGILYCKLRKALYGCVQASKLWYEKLKNFLLRQGYKRCEVDPCLFRRVHGDKTYLLVVYVDDILIIAEREEIVRLES